MTSGRQIRNSSLKGLDSAKSIVVFFILTIILLLSSCSSPTVIDDPVTKPGDAISCESIAGEYRCADPSNPAYTFTITNVPEGVKPYMLLISDGEKELIQNLPMDFPKESSPADTYNYCLGPVLGNLVFYDKNDNLVTLFLKEPLTITFNNSFKDLRSGVSPKCKEGLENVIPVYLYAPQAHPEIRIWKPFQNYEYDDKGQITITFRAWGDQRVGIVVTDQAGYGPKR